MWCVSSLSGVVDGQAQQAHQQRQHQARHIQRHQRQQRHAAGGSAGGNTTSDADLVTSTVCQGAIVMDQPAAFADLGD
jgi:hypothetical protein